MLKQRVKFENLEDELVDLPEILKNSLQKEVLEIRKLDKDTEKFRTLSENFCDLNSVVYVIFSKFMPKEYHELETFVFIDSTGKIVCNLSGRELDLYNMIKECDNLIESSEY
jgi:superfamily II helicase